jgi:hypothetical protein
MTKEQKVTEVTDLVQDLRKRYTFQEFADMVVAVWNALEVAAAAAQENNP